MARKPNPDGPTRSLASAMAAKKKTPYWRGSMKTPNVPGKDTWQGMQQGSDGEWFDVGGYDEGVRKQSIKQMNYWRNKGQRPVSYTSGPGDSPVNTTVTYKTAPIAKKTATKNYRMGR